MYTHLLTILMVIPLLGAIILVWLPRNDSPLAKQVGLLFSLVTVALAIVMAVKFDNGGAGFQFAERHSWISYFGVSYAVGVDGIAMVLIVLTAILVPVVMVSGWHDTDGSTNSANGYFALMLVLETLMIGVFAATDVFLFYVFFEAMLIPMYFLIGRYGGPQRSYAAVKFLLYSLLGGLLMLAALIGLYVVSIKQLGAGTFDFTTLSTQLHLDPNTEKLLFLGFFTAFAVKAPLWPVHTWLPDAAAEATPSSAVLLVGVMDKVGTFGMIRYCLPLFPHASHYFTNPIIVLAIISIGYGALVAIGQADIKRLIAYTSVSHFGFIVLGIFAMTSQGQSGATLYMVNHGFSTGALFILAGYLISRRGSRMIGDFGGVQKVAPVLAGTFLLAGLSSLALPGLSSFVSEFLVLIGTFSRYKWAGVAATTGIVLAAIYILYLYQRTMTGPVREGVEKFKDLNWREIAALAPLFALIIALGIFPQVALRAINPAVAQTMTTVGATDPKPVAGGWITTNGGTNP